MPEVLESEKAEAHPDPEMARIASYLRDDALYAEEWGITEDAIRRIERLAFQDA